MKIALRVVKWQFKLTGGKLFTVIFFSTGRKQTHTNELVQHVFLHTRSVPRSKSYVDFLYTVKFYAKKHYHVYLEVRKVLIQLLFGPAKF